MKVLIAEDEPVSRKVLEKALRNCGYEVVVCGDGVEAWQALQKKNPPQLAVLDWLMPGLDGVAVCRKIREGVAEPYIYVMLLTAKGQKSDIVEGLAAGADDYLVKPFDLPELAVRLRAGQRIIELQTELVQAREALRFQATHDALTGVSNRAAVFDALRRELARSRRNESSVCVVLADIDHFKSINDTYGHAIGDAVLQETVDRIASSFRPYDDVGRYGGEEFLLVVPECDATQGADVAERIRQRVAARPFETPADQIPVTLSLGVASSEMLHEIQPDALIQTADAALYRAKDRGRDRVEVAATSDYVGCALPEQTQVFTKADLVGMAALSPVTA